MKYLYFFIGTEAELMKMFRTIQEARKRGYVCKIVSNGQNDIRNSPFLEMVGGKIDIDLTAHGEKEKNASGYLGWYLRTERLGVKKIKEELKTLDRESALMIVHGDTLSTLMGARIAKKSDIKYVHVESGARSYNWFSPFPEEIDRYFSSKNSIMNFCAKDEYATYAEKAFKGKAISTKYNTGIETLYYAIEENKKKKKDVMLDGKYFLLAIHRQENLMNAKFMRTLFKKIAHVSEKMQCLFIYHEQTKNSLEKNGLWEEISKNPNIKIIPRQGYCGFINLVVHSEFVIADGCGNQQEFFYLGKPYLIMRTKVEENSEGIGWNAKYFENNFDNVDEFIANYQSYCKPAVIPDIQPSKIIMDEIDSYFRNK